MIGRVPCTRYTAAYRRHGSVSATLLVSPRVGVTVAIVRSLGDLADLVASLPANGPLPVRTVVVPNERRAHALRRALVRTGRESALVGTRFVGPLTLALEVVRDAGLDLVPGEEGLRPSRLLALFTGELKLEHFDLALLREATGWPAAFARSIGDLEAAGLKPDDLPAATAQWRDLAAIWKRLDADAGASSTAARTLLAAARLLEAGARPATGPVLAAVSGRETAALARFLAALPGATLALPAARPRRERYLARVDALYGRAARDALASAPLPEATATERDLLARFLFSSPALLADPARPRSKGPDGTVELSEHSGVEEELEAAADWVARELLERATPLERIAVLTPSKGPLLPLLAARLARLPWNGRTLPIHVDGGLPLAGGGARALAIVRALAGFLPARALAEVLPALKTPDGKHLSIDDAVSLAWSLGTVGGNVGDPGRALDWTARAAARETALAAELAALEAEPAADARKKRNAESALSSLRSARPALDALVALAAKVVKQAPLAELAPALVAFLKDWLLDPGPGTPVHALLDDALAPARTDPATGRLSGLAALSLVEDRLRAIHSPTARFGEPALFVGPLAAATGLDFDAVRIVGLAEGTLPSAAREDPVLPEPMRREAHALLVPLAEDRVVEQLHAFDGALLAAERSIALSFPRSDLARSEREPSSLFIEIGAALGRPDALAKGAIPDLRSLDRTSFGPAREGASAFRAERPVGELAWQDRAAGTGEVPPAWPAEGAVAIEPILAALAETQLGPATGVLGRAGPFPTLPGVGKEKSISASALERLLSCPCRFFYERVLKWGEPAAEPSVRELDALTFGNLLHATMEAFYRAHGEPFVARKGTLASWIKKAQPLADEQLAATLETHPLVGQGVVEKERNRLRRDVARFLAYDWELKLDRFVAVELPFGTPEPLPLEVGGKTLHVGGFIDRIDVEDGHALLRDLKTGRSHPREGKEAGPTPGRDVQLGLYALVTRALAAKLQISRKLQAAYAYVGHAEERAFRADYTELETATKEWLALAARLLEARAFPPTPDANDCGFCPFAPICGDEVPALAREASARGCVGEFLALRRGEAAAEGEEVPT